jgi:hypothetical protein
MKMTSDEKAFYLLLCGRIQYDAVFWILCDLEFPHRYKTRPLLIEEAYEWQKKFENG